MTYFFYVYIKTPANHGVIRWLWASRVLMKCRYGCAPGVVGEEGKEIMRYGNEDWTRPELGCLVSRSLVKSDSSSIDGWFYLKKQK